MKTGKLRVVEGFLSKKLYEIPEDKPISIGRDRRRHIPIMSRRVSRDHARVEFRNGTYSITDLKSKQGTLVNNKKITNTVLRHNDLVKIADVVFRFVLEEAEMAEERQLGETPAPKKPVILGPRPTPPPPEPEAPPLAKARPTKVAVPSFTEEERQFLGQTVAGIKIIAPLAKGRRTLIFKGSQSAMNRIVALKLIKPKASKDIGIARWFSAGTKASAKLRHEDTLTPLGGGRENDMVFSFSPYMENGNAEQYFANAIHKGLASVKRALEAIVHAARALEYGLSKNTLHLGLRPTKILFNEGWRPKLIGLGFDNALTAPGAESSPEIAAYAAPEQQSGSAPVSHATDTFALGATFYYMLTGEIPERDHRQRIPSPKRFNPAVPDSICRIIERMLAPEPKQRYADYGQLIHDLRWALRGESWPQRPRPAGSRK